MIAIGPKGFEELLAGFHDMDEHFRTAAPENNLPLLMGLLTVWYNNFSRVGVMPYSDNLKRFPAYLQQLQMESNGKHVDLDRDCKLPDRPDPLGRARNRRAALVLPTHSSRDKVDPVRSD